MRKIYSLEDGRFAVKLARDAVKNFIETGETLSPPENFPPKFQEKSGVFVTLKTIARKGDKTEKNLRGCIGYPIPHLPLIEAIIDSAINSATRDSRFYPPFGPGPVVPEELTKIVFEVSILTPPELLKVDNPTEYLKKIKIGRDGLIVEREFIRGLLLPQVPVEWKWNVKEFLEHTCNKAGLPADCWKKPDVKMYNFQAIIFEEVEPQGEIRRKEIGED